MADQDMPNKDLKSRLAATANPQLTASFFSMLPLEVRRMIYVEYWRSSLPHLKLHIIRDKSGRRFVHSPCYLPDQNGVDIRIASFNACSAAHQSDQDDSNPEMLNIWASRIQADWALHWKCESSWIKRARRPRRSFLPVLLSCKLMYLECIESIFSNLTFVFTDATTAEHFIDSHLASGIRFVELCLCLPSIYFPGVLQVPTPLHIRAPNMPWSRLCETLAQCTSLRELNIWCDVKMEQWQELVYERPFFESLFDITTVPRESFVLALPHIHQPKNALPPRPPMPGIQDSYLEGDNLDGVPFTVKRGPRPDYWEAFLAWERMNQRPVLTIDAGPSWAGP